ncbi:hypothetical protein ACLKA7_005096 [Drosophila subpalustris]
MDREEWTALSELFEDFIPWELCVPSGQRKRVLQECRDALTAGQQGLGKTVSRLSQQYFWPAFHPMDQDDIIEISDEEEQKTQTKEPRTATVVAADKDNGGRGDD